MPRAAVPSLLVIAAFSWHSLALGQASGAGDTSTVTVQGRRANADSATDGRAASSVSRKDLDERLPRSAPDALRYEPGVFIQQTGHGQASAYLRGRTGQQTVLLFDGIRLNTSTWRQGPNQYLFTVDTHSIQRIDVVRGGASTQFGSDALGGVIDSIPLQPRVEDNVDGWKVRPRTFLRYASADASFGNRLQLDTQVSENLQVLAGFGYQRVGKLRSGGQVASPVTGERAEVPLMESDGKTQHGTGFRELAGDTRLVYWLSPTQKLTAASYVFREYDAPRADQCPAPGAPLGECLNVDEQFRSLVYASFDGDLGKVAQKAKIALSFQRQHERRTLHRPDPAFVRLGGRDSVNTFGLTAKATSRWFDLGAGIRTRTHYGLDNYLDTVDSAAYLEFYNLNMLMNQSRGQYLNGSRYSQGGVFGIQETSIGGRLIARLGGRAGYAHAKAPSDPESGTASVDRTWDLVAATASLEWRALRWLSLLANADRSVRAPNLDDLTSRQQTGPGFQFENPNLSPETGTTVEAGMRVDHPYVSFEGWAYRSLLSHAMTRSIRSDLDCPDATPQCQASKRRVQLINLAGDSTIVGGELWIRGKVPGLAVLTATLSYARGEGPSPAEPNNPNAAREPLSRVPPLNGTVDLRVGRPQGAFAGAGLRWAQEQTRLSTTDYGDARIPRFGTPGFAVLDLRGGYRMHRDLVAVLVVENVTDTAYRYHGSSINGPGRGVIFSLEAGM